MLLDYIDEVRARYDAWWRGENAGPLLYILYPQPGADLTPAAREWMNPVIYRQWTTWRQEFAFGQAVELAAQTGSLHYVDDAADLLERYADLTGRAGDGYHFLFVNLGASMMSALMTGVTKFYDGTIWVEHDPPMDLDAVLAMDESAESPYAAVAFEAMQRLVDRLGGRFVFGIPELGGLLDVLSALRKPQNLLLDTMDEPAKLDAACTRLQRLWWHYHRRMSAILDPANPRAYAQAMRYLSGEPNHIATCDFSAMIGPDAFARWALPQIAGECEHFNGRVVYHLDGPGELVHLDALLGLEKLHGIQWVSGAGNPGGLDERWHPLYRRILDAGKRICLSGTPSDAEAFRAFFRIFPASEFLAGLTARDEKHAVELAELGR